MLQGLVRIYQKAISWRSEKCFRDLFNALFWLEELCFFCCWKCLTAALGCQLGGPYFRIRKILDTSTPILRCLGFAGMKWKSPIFPLVPGMRQEARWVRISALPETAPTRGTPRSRMRPTTPVAGNGGMGWHEGLDWHDQTHWGTSNDSKCNKKLIPAMRQIVIWHHVKKPMLLKNVN